LRHLDHAWASTVHAFQGRTVDRVIAAMEARHRHLTTQKSFYVEISRARDRAELVTDDAKALREQLEAVTGERIAALEAIGETPRPDMDREPGKAADGDQADGRQREREPERAAGKERDRSENAARDRQKAGPDGQGRPERGAGIGKGHQPTKSPGKTPEPPSRGRGKGDMDLGM
ncbi:MAG: hypothetical protein OXH59_11175, partial [Rhodospirillaceae bacterium]|nr:hypothetical protein [Rhodospirillaceae bacterium]